jgi:hypothetical protein
MISNLQQHARLVPLVLQVLLLLLTLLWQQVPV